MSALWVWTDVLLMTLIHHDSTTQDSFILPSTCVPLIHSSLLPQTQSPFVTASQKWYSIAFATFYSSESVGSGPARGEGVNTGGRGHRDTDPPSICTEAVTPLEFVLLQCPWWTFTRLTQEHAVPKSATTAGWKPKVYSW